MAIRHKAAIGAAAALLLASAGSWAQRLPVDRRSPVDARVRLLFDHRSRTGRTLPLFGRGAAFEESGLAPLLVRWRREPSPAERARWSKLGWEERGRLRSGTARVLATERAIVAMLAAGVLERASVDLPPPWLARPLDGAAIDVGLPAAAAAFRKASNGVSLDGEGVVVGDIDGTADYYHPAFFKPLAPAPWIDVDGDGTLTAGIDGVDVDGSGAVDPPEVLKLLPARGSSLFADEGNLYGTDDPAFNPASDYLWLDWNGDGRRNVGPDVEGAETLPCLGEPVYAVDDVNRDGFVRPPERVIPLGESKFRAIRSGGKECLRGQNLTECNVITLGDVGSHASRMLGAIAGGQSGVSRFLGMAPEAELVLSTYGLDPLTEDLEFVLAHGANVVLTELGDFGTGPADGSTELELGLDAAVEDGVVAVSPAGNLGYSKKHAFATLPAQGAGQIYMNGLVMEDPASTSAVAVTWREGDTDATGILYLADGDEIDLATDVTNGETASGRSFTVVHGSTVKGAGYLVVMIGGASIPPQGNMLTLLSAGPKALTASLYASDSASAWAGGLNFNDGDVAGCMNAPAFAENTIAVSAYALHVGSDFAPYPEKSGQLRGFSGRGPDLWGDAGIDLAAPDNGIAAMAESYEGGLPDGFVVSWKESGGTSGSGATAAGIAALVVQANPGLGGLELRQKVLDAARATNGDDNEWGAGKLGAGVAAPGSPPVVKLGGTAPGGAVTLIAEVTDDGDPAAARARWDFGYEGTWDVDWQPGLSAQTSILEGAAFLDVKVEVMDADGWMVPAVARIEPSPPLPPPGTKTRGEGDDSGCGCRSAPVGPAFGGWALAAAVALVAARRARYSRRPWL